MNNFYCNHLSGNYIENNLLYVITMMLKDEIDKLENINQVDKFLENTKCGFLLEELIKIPEIQIYFKKVIFKTVEKIERIYSFREINFKVSKILEELIKLKNDEENKINKNNDKNIDEYYKKIINSTLIDLSINYSKEENNRKNAMNNEIFIKQYSPDITIKDIEIKSNNAKKENKNNLVEYFSKLEEDLKNKEDIYSNTTLMQNMLETTYPSYILPFYQNNFLEIISFIDQLLEDLMNNILLLPNSVKFICKIISMLIKNKFKNITKTEENAFISKFIIEKLLIPIFSLPSFNALISDFVVSGNTIKNINIINFILIKLFSGKLFHNNKEEGDYTPFNWYFTDKMEIIFDFFEKSINVNLPNFIEKYINKELPEDYLYDFFKENKELICVNISICFNFNNLYYLINGLEKDNKLFQITELKKLKMALSRLQSEETMNEIKDVDTKNHEEHQTKIEKNKDNPQKAEKENYYLYNDLIIEKKYEKLFSINNKISNYYIDIKKENNIDGNEKNIIKVKNYLCSSLGNYRLLNKSDFNIGTTSDTIKILNEIKSYMALPNFILSNNTIPSIWYINSILDYLNKIPEEYKENDYKKLFIELTENLKQSIDHLDFEKLILFRNKLKFIDKINNYYEDVKRLFNNILINENIKKIVEEDFIPVEIVFKYDDEAKIFELTKSNIKEKLFEDKIKYEIPKKKITVFKTIEAFTRYFPNLSKYQSLQDISPLKIIKQLSINRKIKDYFQIIKEKLTKKGHIDSKLYETLYQEKIQNYIMNKIYEKIYPPEPDEMDNKIFKKAIQLSWVEPNLILGKDYILDKLLPDILNEFEKINIVKSPYKKLNCIKKIFKYIENLIKFNEGEDKEVGPDDIESVLEYVFIKAHPYNIFTNLEFIKIFSDNYGKHEICLTNLEVIYKLILNCKAEYFHLTQEEFEQKCNKAGNENKKK